MKKNDNQIAENIFRTQALENYPEVVYTTTQAIASLKNVIDKALNIKCGKDYMLMDGYGLSEYNLMTPFAHLVKAISYLYQNYDFKMLDYFTTTKEKGTLNGRLSFQV